MTMPAYRAKKRLGQNFLRSKAIIDRVLGLAAPGTNDKVVEIGPGRGALTVPLAESGALVWAIEFDRDLMSYLDSLLGTYSNVRLINGDFLGFDPAAEKLDRFKLVGNLPYNITSPVIDWCLKYRDRLVCAVLMVQRELGARVAGSPGSKDWSPLSIFTQSVFGVERCFDVAPSHFTPAPKVTSTVIRLTPHPVPLVRDSAPFEKVVRASFRHRRKLLVNNLVPEIIPDGLTAAEILEQVGLGAKTRAEEVTIEQFLKLTTELVGRKLI
jgi:16S rRNA (adenine1518-N6/adenine1519-N6)-dimethyltransferase